MEFKERLKELRQDSEITQEELGIRSGLEGSAVSHFETGARRPSLHNLIKLCRGLQCSASDLVDIDAK